MVKSQWLMVLPSSVSVTVSPNHITPTVDSSIIVFVVPVLLIVICVVCLCIGVCVREHRIIHERRILRMITPAEDVRVVI